MARGLPGPNPASEKKVDRYNERPSKATISREQYNPWSGSAND